MKTRTREQTIISGITKVTIQKRLFFIWFSFGCYYKDAQGSHFFLWDFKKANNVKYKTEN